MPPGSTTADRPTSLLVFGILNFGFAAMGLFGIFSNAVLFLPGLQQSGNPVIELMHESTALQVWTVTRMLVGGLLVLVLAGGGLGLVTGRNWGRTVTLGYAVFLIAFQLVAVAADYVLVLQPLQELARSAGDPQTTGAVAGAWGGFAGNCLGLIYPAAALYFLTRPNVVSYFKPPLAETFD